MSRITLIACIIAVLAGTSVFFMARTIKKQKTELSRRQGNIEALTGEAVRFKTKAGKDAETVQALTLKNTELEMFNSRLARQVSDLNIKLRDVKAAHTVETITKIDTVVVTEKTEIPGTYRFKYADAWNKIEGLVSPDSTKITQNSVDTVDIINHVKQKRFLFFRIGKPKIKTTVTNQNPKTKLHVRFSAEL